MIKPLVLYLLDPEEPPISDSQLVRALDSVESWMVRRMIVRATTKSYTQIIAELVSHLRPRERQRAGEDVEAFLRQQVSDSRFWPDDDQIRQELKVLQAYRRLSRGRMRMLLEAIEDFRRGWRDNEESIGAERVTRNKFAIEHVMPRKWQKHWPLEAGKSEEQRDALVHTIGNLTLLMGKLNSKVSNGSWDTKRIALKDHDVLMLNKDCVDATSWTDAWIANRTTTLAEAIIQIWPTPEGHVSEFRPVRVITRQGVQLADLIANGWLAQDAKLHPRQKKHAGAVGTLLADGRIDVAGVIYASASEAAKAITGGKMNGWWFFQIEQPSGRVSLKDIRLQYLESVASEMDEEDSEDDDDED